jgi:hypothetical protein
MQSGIIIEGLTYADLVGMFKGMADKIDKLEATLKGKVRPVLTLTELCREKGYKKDRMRKIIKAKSIPFSYEGREMVVKREERA